MTHPFERIDRYWTDRLGLGEVLHRSGVHVVPHVRTSNDDLAFVFVKGTVGVLSVARSHVESTRDRVAQISASSLLDEECLRATIDGPISHFVGPFYEGFAESGDFLPSPSELVLTLNRSHRKEVQALATACEQWDSTLTPVWRDLVEQFTTASASVEVEHSGLARADSSLFAAVLGEGHVVAMAHYSMWASDAASVGVLTHPAHRGCGYGKAVVSAAMADALSRGYLVLYRTLLANRASVSLATSVGCRDYARFLAIHLAAAA